jgi:GT2 family glycosyltransferase
MSILEQTAKPSLSVVIASCVGPPFITKCLESLNEQRESIEVIVVDRAGETVA